MQQQQQVIGIFVITTLKYHVFAQPLFDSIDEFFLPNHKIEIHLFTDQYRDYQIGNRIGLHQYLIEPYRFPLVTLFRYKIFCENVKLTNEEYIFYFDADMLCVSTIRESILNEITVVHHPGFYANGKWGSEGVDKRSTAYFEPEERKEYVAGGFNGGSRKEFMKISNILAHNIAIDYENGVIAIYHDETHLNKLISTMTDRSKVKILPPAYCMVEQENLRIAWGINHFEPKIIALEKIHSEIRN